MDKRAFLRTLGGGIMLSPFLPGSGPLNALPADLSGTALQGAVTGNSSEAAQTYPPAILGISGMPEKIFPPALKKGDTIGVISPSATLFEEMPFQFAREVIQALGFKVKMGEHVNDRYGHLAGSDKERAGDLNKMFADPEVKGIICLRGGSGAARILPLVDYESIRARPKVFMGYSDITALHMAIYTQTGLVTFHGPMASSAWPGYNAAQFRSLFLDGALPAWKNPQSKGDDLIIRQNRTRTIQSGQASGELLGGNLSVLTGIAGSKYFPDFSGKIMFLEEVGEQLYRVDRMMSQLQLCGALENLAGFIFGQCTECNPGEGYGSLTLDEILDHYIRPLDIPAYSGALIGHISRQFILPVGGSVRMDAGQGSFTLLEPVFS
ncbi:S66 peptidase family protein [Anseongella ginsenosidimutans]|nr:LD-carboxypeptidase [Anseongella ginsenosidimutans]